MHQKIRKYAKELKFVVDEYLNLDVLLAFEDFLKRQGRWLVAPWAS